MSLISALRKLVSKESAKPKRQQHRFSLRLEALEDRIALSTLTVDDDPGADYTSIQVAVNAAADGDVIQVAEGTYNESVNVTKELTLEGANAGISAGPKGGVRGDESVVTGGFRLADSNITLDGFLIQGIFNGANPAGVFIASNATDLVIQNNVLTGGGTHDGIITTFNGNNENITIQGNEISGRIAGIRTQTATNVDIIGNDFHDNVVGVSNDFANDVLIQGNDFKNHSLEAIGVFDSDVEVTNNDLDGNTKTVNHYGGDPINAELNWWGTTDPAVIEASMINPSQVDYQPFLLDSVFAGNNHIYQGDGCTLIVNAETGDFQYTDADGNVFSGDGARIQNGKLKIHDVEDGNDDAHKIDVTGSAEGDIEAVLKFKGSNKKVSCALSFSGVAGC